MVKQADLQALAWQVAQAKVPCPIKRDCHTCGGDVGHLINCPNGIATSRMMGTPKPCGICLGTGEINGV